MKTEDLVKGCPMCKPVLMYEDMDGHSHKTERQCALAQVRIMQERKAGALIDMLLSVNKKGCQDTGAFGRYLDISHTAFARGQRNDTEDFIRLLVEHGFTITKGGVTWLDK